jgi:hypothetical protein
MQDERMSIVSNGTYRIATVKGNDNYGVNPVEVNISGNGWDTINLWLKRDGGIPPVGTYTDPWLASEIPLIRSIKFDDKLYQKMLVEDRNLKFYTSSQPKVKVRITAGNLGINPDTLSVVLNRPGMVQESFNRSQFSDYTEIPSPTPNRPTEINFSLNFKTLPVSPLDGDNTFNFRAENDAGPTEEAASVSVTGALEIVGTPITYPSPLHLATDNQVTFQYGLSRDANIDIYIFDIAGTIIKKFSFNAGSLGGLGGGSASPNKVIWSLLTDQGSRLGVGIYLFEIVNRDSNKIIGKGKLPAAP